jgi:phenylalanyl-tRNA synthetase alpha chain
MLEELKKIQTEALKEIVSINSADSLENFERKYLGRNGQLRDFSLKLKDMTAEERVNGGKIINEVRQALEQAIGQRKEQMQSNISVSNTADLDLTLPSTDQKVRLGHQHPHTQTKNQVAEIFQSMGFQVLEGPEVENEHYAFDVLNIPASHPARDMWDTFWLDTKITKLGKLLLRPHTTSMQVRVMEKQKLPLRACVIGKCYRHESTDASHEHSFYQIDGFVVDQNISVANLIYTLNTFLAHIFGQEVKTRLRPSYFPFTEPSFELDFACLACGGKGCPVCGQTGWVEMLGCGMIHPKVLAAAGYPKGKYTGFAFGVGLDRLVMMKHKIDDIRWFNSGDLRFLRQF